MLWSSVSCQLADTLYQEIHLARDSIIIMLGVGEHLTLSGGPYGMKVTEN